MILFFSFSQSYTSQWLNVITHQGNELTTTMRYDYTPTGMAKVLSKEPTPPNVDENME